MKKRIVFLLVILIASGSFAWCLNQGEYPPLLDTLQIEMQRTLNRLDDDLGKLSRKISGNDLRSFFTRKLLYKFCQDHSLIVAAGTLDKYGNIITLEPGLYKKYQGEASGYFEKRYSFQKPHKPFLTKAFNTVSSYFVVTLIHPIHDSDHNWIGSVGIVFKPDSFFTALVKPVIQGLPVDAWVLETDGTQIYDPNPEEISRNIFTDPLYSSYDELRKLTKEIVKEKSGVGSYQFLDSAFNKVVKKKAYWTTIGLHGTKWRVVLTRIELGEQNAYRREFPDLISGKYYHDLRTLSRSNDLHAAIFTRRKRNVIKFLEKFYKSHPGIYSIQWIDPFGINRYGFPVERSLKNYDFSDFRFKGDKDILKAVIDRKEISFQRDLYEGKTGKYYMTPVFARDEYLGMLYFIKLLP